MVMDMARFYQIGRPSGWPAGIAERRSAYRRQGPGAAVGKGMRKVKREDEITARVVELLPGRQSQRWGTRRVTPPRHRRILRVRSRPGLSRREEGAMGTETITTCYEWEAQRIADELRHENSAVIGVDGPTVTVRGLSCILAPRYVLAICCVVEVAHASLDGVEVVWET
jgi:hypothetical protein